MMTSNNALIPDPDKEDILASKPFDWPFLHLGLRMCGWGAEQHKYYLMGTPVIWWASTISLFVAVLVLVVYLLRMQRKYVDMDARAPHVSSQVITFELFLQANGIISYTSSKLLVMVGYCILVCMPVLQPCVC